MTTEAKVLPAGSFAPPGETTDWDRIAETTSWGRYLTSVEKEVILRGLGTTTQPGAAVDFGCGGGRWAKLLADRGWKLTCLDVSAPTLAICQRNVSTASCLLMSPDASVVPLPSASAQLALCIEVIPLIESDWFAPEVHRVLSDGGLFIGVYINGRSLRGALWRLKRRLGGCGPHENFYRNSYPAFRQGLIRTGFELLHEESFCWGPFSRSSNSPFVPACAKMERALGLNRIVGWSPWIVFIARKRPDEPSGSLSHPQTRP